jgi:hypothetical protein
VTLRLFVVGLAWTLCLNGQNGQKKGFDFGEACFRNPSLPYCPNREFVPKPPPKDAGKYGVGSPAAGNTLSMIDAAGIDWRFADPSADTLAALNWSNLPASSSADSVIRQLASTRGLSPAEAQKIFPALSGVNQVALSVSPDAILIMVAGRPADAILPALEAGWKSTPFGENALLIGHAAAVDLALKRLSTDSALGDLPQKAQQRTVGGDFWVVGSARLAGPEAVSAGVKRFQLTASMGDRLTSDTVFEFDSAPDPGANRAGLTALGDAKIEGNAVHATISMNADETRRNLTQIAASPLGRALEAFIQSARYLPMRDTAATVHTKPVIFGLDGGPREVK